MTTVANIKTREFRLRKRYDEVRGLIYRRLHQFDDASTMKFTNHLSEVEDQVEADQLNDIDVAQHNLELQELQDIDAALLRIRGGTYGICETCGEKIASDRLDASPCAKRCVGCQSKSEHFGKSQF